MEAAPAAEVAKEDGQPEKAAEEAAEKTPEAAAEPPVDDAPEAVPEGKVAETDGA